MEKPKKHRRNDLAIQTLAKNIKLYRSDRNLTILQLANLIDVDYSQVGRMERGTVNSSVSIIFDIATALGISPGKLLES